MSEDQRTVINPGEVIRPYVDLDIVKELVKTLYGLEVLKGEELNSYDDRNYHILVTMETTNQHIKSFCPNGYVFKVLNALDSKDEDYVDAQNRMILHVSNQGIATSRPVVNKYGSLMSLESFTVNKRSPGTQNEGPVIKCIVRLMEYIPGRILMEVPYTASLMYKVGQITGQLDKSLTDFSHPALMKHKRIWNLTELPKISQFTYCLRNTERQNLIQTVLDQFQTNVIENYSRLKKGTLHADVNDQNILLSKTPSGQGHTVEGILDFGDAVYSYYIFEVAIMLCYVILGSDVIDRVEACGHTLAGYLSEFPLEKQDLCVLKECICGRLATSLVMGAYSAENDPENSEYLLTTGSKGWSILTDLMNTPNTDLYRQLASVCYDQYNIKADFGV